MSLIAKRCLVPFVGSCTCIGWMDHTPCLSHHSFLTDRQGRDFFTSIPVRTWIDDRSQVSSLATLSVEWYPVCSLNALLGCQESNQMNDCLVSSAKLRNSNNSRTRRKTQGTQEKGETGSCWEELEDLGGGRVNTEPWSVDDPTKKMPLTSGSEVPSEWYHRIAFMRYYAFVISKHQEQTGIPGPSRTYPVSREARALVPFWVTTVVVVAVAWCPSSLGRDLRRGTKKASKARKVSCKLQFIKHEFTPLCIF